VNVSNIHRDQIGFPGVSRILHESPGCFTHPIWVSEPRLGNSLLLFFLLLLPSIKYVEGLLWHNPGSGGIVWEQNNSKIFFWDGIIRAFTLSDETDETTNTLMLRVWIRDFHWDPVTSLSLSIYVNFVRKRVLGACRMLHVNLIGKYDLSPNHHLFRSLHPHNIIPRPLTTKNDTTPSQSAETLGI
jgi:hypothetical protein